MTHYFESFVRGYLKCALWSSHDETDDGEPLDTHHDEDDIHPDTLMRMRQECEDFITAAGGLLEGSIASQAGHDFWLTRNGHGTGFWDRAPDAYPNDVEGKELTSLAHSFGERDLYVGDDHKIHQ